MPDVGLQLALEEHLDRVAVEAAQELRVAQAAARAALAIPDALGLGPFLGPVLTDSKPRLLLRFHAGQFHRWPEDEVILKIYGEAPRGEGPLQSRWWQRGIRTLPVAHGRDGPCSWVLMPHVALRQFRPTSVEQWLALTDAVAAQVRRMHEPAPALAEVLRPLDAVMLPRLQDSVASLLRAGHHAPKGWELRAATAYRQLEAPLHGDLALRNVALAPDGEIVIYDASALFGPPGFDAARWAARASSVTVPAQAVLDRWAQHEPLPEMDLLHELLAAECLLEAGTRCTVARREGAASPDVSTLLRTAAVKTG